MHDLQCQIVKLKSPTTFLFATPAGDTAREMAIENMVELLRFSSSKVDEGARLVEPWGKIFIFLIRIILRREIHRGRIARPRIISGAGCDQITKSVWLWRYRKSISEMSSVFSSIGSKIPRWNSPRRRVAIIIRLRLRRYNPQR